MGYIHDRHIRKVSGTLVQCEPIGASGNDLYLKANSTDAYPLIKLEGNTYIILHTKTDTIFKQITTQTAHISYAANVTTLSGGAITGDNLVLKANTVNTYPFISLDGLSRILASAYNQFDWSFGATPVLAARMKLGADGLGASLHLKETTTPTAIASYGAIYTKNDNKLYFQDGAGTEHTVTIV